MSERSTILCLDRDPTEADARALRPGQRVVRLGERLREPVGTLIGVVGAADAERCVAAAARGWDLVIRLAVPGEQGRLLLDDLRRIGDLVEPAGSVEAPPMDAVETDLLHHLAQGDTLRQAAAAVGLSERTAARRVAALRHRMGAPTTAALLALTHGHGPVRPATDPPPA